MEQREGRVDRYGQNAKVVEAIRYFSPDSAVDGVVLDVLLNKAKEIHRTLGTYVPVPDESETVTEALLNALFLRGGHTKTIGETQLAFEFGEDEIAGDIASFHRRWDVDAEREKINRSRFAQRTLKPADVRQELEVTDAVLGDPDAVREFVLTAAQRLGLSIAPDKRPNVFRVAVSPNVIAVLPAAVSFVLPAAKNGQWLVSFNSPTPDGAEYLGRNHRFVAALARFLMEEALTRSGSRHGHTLRRNQDPGRVPPFHHPALTSAILAQSARPAAASFGGGLGGRIHAWRRQWGAGVAVRRRCAAAAGRRSAGRQSRNGREAGTGRCRTGGLADNRIDRAPPNHGPGNRTGEKP